MNRSPIKRGKPLARKSRIGETRIRQLRPGEPVPEGEPRCYKSDPRGYVRLRWRVGTGEYVETYEHRLVAGVPEGDVHHDDEVKDNNADSNLRVMTKSEHAQTHGAEATANSRSAREWGGAPSQAAFNKRERTKQRRIDREAKLAEVGRLYAEGNTTTEIGLMLNLHPSTVSRCVRAAGVVTRPKHRNTNISAVVRAQVHARSKMRCERCGKNVLWGGGQVHHRRPRQMGGSRLADTNQPENLVMLCDGCHDHVESHRKIAYREGWLVHAGVDPATVPWKSAV